jgi:hypothetical protein
LFLRSLVVGCRGILAPGAATWECRKPELVRGAWQTSLLVSCFLYNIRVLKKGKILEGFNASGRKKHFFLPHFQKEMLKNFNMFFF